MSHAQRGNAGSVSRRASTDDQSPPLPAAAVAAARLAAQRRRRSEADLARAVRLMLPEARRAGRFQRDRTPAEPMN
jgi:hypothetical protein